MNSTQTNSHSLPAFAKKDNVDYPLILSIVIFHLMACLAPFYFTWTGLILAITLVLITCLFGIILGYHRLLTHRSYQTQPLILYILAFLGCLAMQNGPIKWVALHRYHHANSDTNDDLHSPLVNIFWAHFAWIFFHNPKFQTFESFMTITPDLTDDKFLIFLDKSIILLNILSALILWSIGWIWGGKEMAISFLIWGFFWRIVYVWHITFIANSAGHFVGYRNYNLKDNSRNVWWVSLLSFGEGWHNNHHADPQAARLGHLWYEFDLAYLTLRLMMLLGLAHNLIEPRRCHHIKYNK